MSSSRRFRFNLEPLRAVREHAELVAMRELAGELAQAAELQRELEATEFRLSAARSCDAAPATALELATRQAYLERVERELDEAKVRASVQEQHVASTRERLQHAAREREQVDRLEERRRAEHDAEQRRLERAAGDEISILMHLAESGARA
jgi:flagellar export protein FliJ